MKKRLLTLIALVAGAIALGRKVQAVKEEQELWSEATDQVQ